MQPIRVSTGAMLPTGSILIRHPVQMPSAPSRRTPRLWLKLKPIQARHMSVRPPDSLRAESAIADTKSLDRSFRLGSHLNARDAKAVRKTVSGLVKILYPAGEFTKDDLWNILELALEGGRRVKEQLKKMGSLEYHQTSFSYVDSQTYDRRVGGRDVVHWGSSQGRLCH